MIADDLPGLAGVQDGRRDGTTLAGAASFLATCQPALSGRTTGTFRPAGSAQAANSASAWPICSAFTFGSTGHKFRAALGSEKP